MTNKYWNGKEVCVVANEVPHQKGKAIIRIVKEFKPMQNNCMGDTLVDKKNIESLVSDVFALGDTVRVINGSLKGTVTSYELSTNRAVVTSEKIAKYQNDRTRYAYKISELEHFDGDAIKLVIGNWYLINGKEKLMAVQSVFDLDQIMMFSRDGDMIYSNIMKDSSLMHLKDFYGIKTIQRLTKI